MGIYSKDFYIFIEKDKKELQDFLIKRSKMNIKPIRLIVGSIFLDLVNNGVNGEVNIWNKELVNNL